MMSERHKSSPKPKVVFDLKMPRYDYRHGEDFSLSVDRKRTDVVAPADCLANIKGKR